MNRYKVLLFTCLGMAYSLGAQASSDFAGFASQDAHPLGKVIVFFNIADPIVKAQMESYAAKKLAKKKVDAITGTEVMPPIRAYSAEEFKQAVSRSGAQQMFEFTVVQQNAESETQAVTSAGYSDCSGTSHSTYSGMGSQVYGHSSVNISCSSMPASTRNVTSEHFGGQYTITVFDIEPYKVLWKGYGKAFGTERGNDGTILGFISLFSRTDFEDLMRETVRDAVKDLKKDGLL